jgi:hypothetical protein
VGLKKIKAIFIGIPRLKIDWTHSAKNVGKNKIKNIMTIIKIKDIKPYKFGG